MNTKAVFVVCSMVFAYCFAVQCTDTIHSSVDDKYYKFDLSKMSHPSGEADDLYFRNRDGSYLYMNVCGPSSQQCTTGSAVCLRSADAKKFTSLGKAEDQEFDEAPDLDPGQGVQVTYNNGDDCILGSWQTVITFKCDTTVSGVGEIVEVDVGECWYRVTVNSQYACGKEVSSDESGSSDSGDVVALVILIILLVGIVLYFGVGVIYQVKVKEASSFREYIIHNEFWCNLPSLVKDGVLFICHGCKGGDYVSV